MPGATEASHKWRAASTLRVLCCWAQLLPERRQANVLRVSNRFGTSSVNACKHMYLYVSLYVNICICECIDTYVDRNVRIRLGARISVCRCTHLYINLEKQSVIGTIIRQKHQIGWVPSCASENSYVFWTESSTEVLLTCWICICTSSPMVTILQLLHWNSFLHPDCES